METKNTCIQLFFPYTTTNLYINCILSSLRTISCQKSHTQLSLISTFCDISILQMALRGLDIGLVMVLMTALWAGASAQLACTTAIIGMSPCLGYITGNSSAPSSTCCSQLSSVVSNQPQCLCMVLNGGASSFGINLNRTQALALPGACNVQTPPVSRCNGKIHLHALEMITDMQWAEF